MVDAIGEALTQFDAAARRFLLTIKRSCFNGREIDRHRGKAEWADLVRVAPELAERILSLEAALRENDHLFTALYGRELDRERRHILGFIRDHRFLRGVALGRPGLVEKIRAQVSSLDLSAPLKKPTKWEQSLLRFVVRAAVKMSANSTLTAYAWGNLHESPQPGFRFTSAPEREVSLVRVNRPQLEQFQALLLRHPAVREHASIAWNDSLEEIEPGQYRFLREGHWDLTPGAEGFRYVAAARVKVRISNPLVEPAREALRGGSLPYNQLWALLETKNPTVDRSDLDQLVDLGLLLLLPPWPTHEARLERRIGELLRALSDEPALRATAEALDELLALEDDFASSPRPERSVADMEGAYSRLLGTVLPLAGHEGPLTTQAQLFEDVFLEGEDSSDPSQGILEIAATTAQEILESAELVARFAGLFNNRHDVLHTLAAWWRENEPSRREIPFTEIAQGFAPLWKQYRQFHPTANNSALNTFDPLETPAMARLQEMRQNLLSRSMDLLLSTPSKDFLSARQLAELVDTLPRRYAPMVGSSVFVQPMNGEGSTWVLNRLSEGTGRYLSRVTPVLEESLRQRFLNHLAARSVIDLEGEEADLLEVLYPWGHLMSAHSPQAWKVLDYRGLHLDLPEERRVSLGDLKVQADLDTETFRLVDSSGRRVLPVHLCSLTDAGLPHLLRFLLVFGPGQGRGVFPFPHMEGDDDLKILHRLTCGNLVVRRRHWRIGVNNLPSGLDALTDSHAYSALYEWRRRLGLPSVGFYYERTYHGAFKPQYIDFSSPSLCNLFVSSLQKWESGQLILEEALPSPADFPLDAAQQRRGFELLIDSLAIRTPNGNSAGVFNHDRESFSLRKERQHV